MNIVIGLAIGLVVAVVVFIIKENDNKGLKEKQQERLEAQRQDLEKEHQKRLEQATYRLRQDYEAQTEQQIQEAVHQQVAIAQQNAEAEMEQLRQTLEETRQALTQQQSDREQLEIQVEELRDELQQTNSDYQQQIQSLEQEKDSAIVQTRSEYEIRIQELNQALALAQERITQLEATPEVEPEEVDTDFTNEQALASVVSEFQEPEVEEKPVSETFNAADLEMESVTEEAPSPETNLQASPDLEVEEVVELEDSSLEDAGIEEEVEELDQFFFEDEDEPASQGTISDDDEFADFFADVEEEQLVNEDKTTIQRTDTELLPETLVVSGQDEDSEFDRTSQGTISDDDEFADFFADVEEEQLVNEDKTTIQRTDTELLPETLVVSGQDEDDEFDRLFEETEPSKTQVSADDIEELDDLFADDEDLKGKEESKKTSTGDEELDSLFDLLEDNQDQSKKNT